VWINAYADSLEDSEVQSSGGEHGDGGSRNVTATVSVDAAYVIEGIHQRWMFALLGMLESQLVGNDISTLRVLARAAIRLVQVITKDDVNPVQEADGPPGVSDVEGVVNGRDDEEASPAAAAKAGRAQSTIAGCWMVVAAIVGIWGQRDIWDEAREALSTSS
jgi:Survival motor neuron (SMN) interacting protein 1 (SIP1)